MNIILFVIIFILLFELYRQVRWIRKIRQVNYFQLEVINKALVSQGVLTKPKIKKARREVADLINLHTRTRDRADYETSLASYGIHLNDEGYTISPLESADQERWWKHEKQD